MEQSPNTQNTKTVLLAIAILLVLGASYLLLWKERLPEESGQQVPVSNDNQGPVVVVKNTPMVNGIISVPQGFPQDIPLENGSLTESATTEYPGENAQQLSLSYRSSKTITEKYAEYKNYMKASGYKITDGSTNSPVRAIFGVRDNVNLSVVVSSSAEGKTLVQLSYLLK